ncbi:MAG: cadherin-like beta sandwich domain-containing protein, partial [Lachnospiraceae bacterium]|nr:cadherin-like beta sandwich domain-containing protein [Lachnospiraceae bacterium]
MKSMVRNSWLAVMTILMMLIFGMTAMASDDDNSLYALGINTEGVTVTPDFSYDIWEYDVTVPAGTAELSIAPVTSNSNASCAVEGAVLNEDGTGRVNINVTAPNGAVHTYVLNVRPDATTVAPVVETEAPVPATEVPIEPETQPQTEEPVDDTQYVKVDKNTIQEAESTITSLKGEIAQYKETLSLYTKIVYGLIAAAVVLLFVVINQILHKRDLKAELNDYRSYGIGGPDGKPLPTKKELKAQKKAQKKELKAAMKGQAPLEEPETRTQGARPADQGHPQGARPAGQGQPQGVRPASQGQGDPQGVRPAGQSQRPMGYPGNELDVMPQTSRKARQMPEYARTEAPVKAAPAQKSQAPAKAAPAQKGQAPA